MTNAEIDEFRDVLIENGVPEDTDPRILRAMFQKFREERPLDREIAAHNAAVDARRADKRARQTQRKAR